MEQNKHYNLEKERFEEKEKQQIAGIGCTSLGFLKAELEQGKPSSINANKFTITKKIAKHGSQAVLIIPKILQRKLKPGIIAKFTINILSGVEK